MKMIFDLKVKIIVWLIVAFFWLVAGLACYAVKDLQSDLEGLPVVLDNIQKEINWRKL